MRAGILALAALMLMVPAASTNAAVGTKTAHAKYGYPYPNAPDCTEFGRSNAGCVPDRWRFYQGQCTSWVAYRLNQRSGVPFSNSYKGQRWGDAGEWGAAARRAKVTVNGTPAIGAVAWYSSGHVAYVEQASPNVVISEMNADFHNSFQVIGISKGHHWPTGFIHFKDIKPKPKPKPKPTPTGPAPAGIGDSTGFYEPGPSGWHLSNALAPGASNYIFARGESGSIPVVGDWNGDGKDSTGVYYPWDQSWHLRNSLSAGSSDYIFVRGQPNSIPVVGDWNGDGKDSTGAYFPWDQSWHLRNELNSGSSQYAFVRGQPNSIPVVGDWNGDGKDSTGAYFPWDQSWHLRNELNPGSSQYAFVRATPNSIPVVGDWDGR